MSGEAELAWLDLAELGRRYRQRRLSPLEATRAILARIERLNPRLNAYLTVTADSALGEARRAEVELGRGEDRGPLHGAPVGLKDLIDTAGVRTTAASRVHAERVPGTDAAAVRRLKDGGAVLLGKT